MDIHSDDKLCRMFIRQMTKKEVFLGAFFAGSFVEIDEDDFVNHPSDVDIMCYPTYILGLENEDDKDTVVSKSFKGRLIRHTQNHPHCHPGYTTLESSDNSCREITSSPCSVLQKHFGPALTIWMMRDPVFSSLDFVYCLSCQGWPTAASVWKNRPRTSGWPSDDLVEKVISGGYHLVDKPHPWHNKSVGDIFWRISFSRAECLLIQSFNEIQKRVYALLRKIKTLIVQDCKRENGSVLSTYFFKTAMLWLCEEQPIEVWKYENIHVLVKELLCKIIVWLIDRNCPNYFIPENNMLDHLPDDLDLGWEIMSLVEIVESNWSGIETHLANSIRKHDLPIPTKRICANLVSSERWRSAFGIEFEAPFDGGRSNAKLNDSEDYDDIMMTFSTRSDDVEVLSLLYGFLCKRQQDLTGCHVGAGGSGIIAGSVDPGRSISDDKELLNSVCNLSVSSDEILSESISRSDAINLILDRIRRRSMFGIRKTLFVVCGYLANIYFSVEKDYTNAMLISQTLIDACNSSIYFVALSELSFPMLLTPRLSNLFDDNIRAVHGFSTLFRSIDRDNRQLIKVTDPQLLTIKLCAILFLRYIKVQFELNSGDDAKIKSAVQDFFSHMEHSCPTDGHDRIVNDHLSRRVLSTSLRNSLVKWKKHWIFHTLKWPPPNPHHPDQRGIVYKVKIREPQADPSGTPRTPPISIEFDLTALE